MVTTRTRRQKAAAKAAVKEEEPEKKEVASDKVDESGTSPGAVEGNGDDEILAIVEDRSNKEDEGQGRGEEGKKEADAPPNGLDDVADAKEDVNMGNAGKEGDEKTKQEIQVEEEAEQGDNPDEKNESVEKGGGEGPGGHEAGGKREETQEKREDEKKIANEKQDAPVGGEEEDDEDEEGMVKGERAPPYVAEDDTKKSSFDLSKEPRYAGIDKGTLERLTKVLEYMNQSPDVFDSKVLNQVRDMSPSEAKDVMDKLDHSVRTCHVRNLSAYLAGVIRRVSKVPGDARLASIDSLAPEAREVLESLYQKGLVKRGDLDGKAMQHLSIKSPELQVLVMDTFSDRNLRGIRNMAGKLFFNIFSRYLVTLCSLKNALKIIRRGHILIIIFTYAAYFTAHQSQVERDLRDGRLKLPRLGGGHESKRSRSDSYSRDAPASHRTYDYVPTAQRLGTAAASQPGTTPYNPQALSGLYSAPIMNAQPAASSSAAKHYALEQVQWGVRVDEFQALSPYAKYVHPAAALRLQQLWDVDQNKLVSVLDENSWLALAGLDAPNSVKVVNDVAEKMKLAPDDLDTINAIFVSIASKFPRRDDAPPLPGLMATQLGGMGAPMPSSLAALSQISLPSARQVSYDPRLAGMHATEPSVLNPVQLPGPAGTLSPAIQTKIDEILGKWNGSLLLDHFDQRAVDLLLSMEEHAALSILDEYSENDPKNMRNPTAYLIGCLRRTISGQDRRGGGRGRRGRPSSNHRYEPY